MLEQPGEGEHDFVLTTELLLQDLAERVWAAIDEAQATKAKKSNTL
jgi:GAF domain-containing protein